MLVYQRVPSILVSRSSSTTPRFGPACGRFGALASEFGSAMFIGPSNQNNSCQTFSSFLPSGFWAKSSVFRPLDLGQNPCLNVPVPRLWPRRPVWPPAWPALAPFRWEIGSGGAPNKWDANLGGHPWGCWDIYLFIHLVSHLSIYFICLFIQFANKLVNWYLYIFEYRMM